MRKAQVSELRRIALKYGISRRNFRRMKRVFASVPHNKKQAWLRACEEAGREFREQQEEAIREQREDAADECHATQVAGG